MVSVSTVLVMAVAIGAESQPSSITSTSQATEVSTCRLADGRSAIVTRRGNRYTYTFGTVGRPEIRLDADPATHSVFKHGESFPRAGMTELRLATGETSYVLFHYFNLGNYVRNYEGATEVDGLLVLQRGRRIAGHLCRGVDGPRDIGNLGPLPDDPLNLLDDVLNVVEHQPPTLSKRRR